MNSAVDQLKKTSLDYKVTGQLSDIAYDYLFEGHKLQHFFDHEPKLDSFQAIIEQKSRADIDREGLVNAITHQYSHLEQVNEPVSNNIQKLADPKSFTVTTGHQLCLFTGPLYFVYKIFSTINLAKKLSDTYQGHQFIPIFWMASEDHDFAEINHANLFGKRVSWNQDEGGAVGRLIIKNFQSVLEELSEIAGEGDGAAQVKDWLKRSYREDWTLAQATRSLVNYLFGDYGLVIVDGDDRQLKSKFTDVIKNELIESRSFSLISETTQELIDLGYHAQVTPREINLFYLQDGLRERIVKKGDHFEVLNSNMVFSEEEILQEVDQFPERFSPNAVLRPIYQEKILPNIAYFGGGAEVAYWLQLKSSFEHFEVEFPMVLLRNSVMLIPGNLQKKMDKLNISIEDLFEDTDALIARIVQRQSEATLELSAEKEQVEAIYSSISKKAISIDLSLKGSVEAEKQKSLNSLSNLESKLLRAEKRNQETAVNQINGIKDKLFPYGGLQERTENFIPFYLRYGDSFFESLSNSLDPLAFELTILE